MVSSSQLHVGAMLCVIRDRWDVPTGTLAKAESVEATGLHAAWYFTCEWLPGLDMPAPRRTRSLTLFEDDFAVLSLMTVPLAR